MHNFSQVAFHRVTLVSRFSGFTQFTFEVRVHIPQGRRKRGPANLECALMAPSYWSIHHHPHSQSWGGPPPGTAAYLIPACLSNLCLKHCHPSAVCSDVPFQVMLPLYCISDRDLFNHSRWGGLGRGSTESLGLGCPEVEQKHRCWEKSCLAGRRESLKGMANASKQWTVLTRLLKGRSVLQLGWTKGLGVWDQVTLRKINSLRNFCD